MSYKRDWNHILLLIPIIVFGVLIALEAAKNQMPYIDSIAKLKSKTSTRVQFMGKIVHDAKSKNSFNLKDKDSKIVKINYLGVKPTNFSSAEYALITGTYNGDSIDAEKVMVKCPSKYVEK